MLQIVGISKMLFQNLQIFGGEGGDGAGAAPGPGPEAGAGVTAPDAGEQAQKQDRKAKAPAQQWEFGQPTEQAVSGAAQKPAEQAQPARESWEDVKKRYKDEYGKDVQTAIQGRFKANKAAEEERSKMMELLTRIGGARYEGVVRDGKLDLKALAQAVDNDDEWYEDEAAKRGMSVETYKLVERLEREAAERKARDEAQARDQQMYAEYQKIVGQAEAAKKFYPDLDLHKEMDNARFARLVSNGVDVQTAYEVVHRNEIMGGMMGFAAQKAATAISNSIQAGAARPSENGLGKQAAANVTRITDPRLLTKEQRKALREQVRHGKKIVW